MDHGGLEAVHQPAQARHAGCILGMHRVADHLDPVDGGTGVEHLLSGDGVDGELAQLRVGMVRRKDDVVVDFGHRVQNVDQVTQGATGYRLEHVKDLHIAPRRGMPIG